MDTRFWGPSGWRLLHSISFAYNPSKDKSAMRAFFSSLPFVLPCKFCRASLSEYYIKHPLEPALESQATLSRWLWTIHNEVNAKLRSQSLPVADDPPFEKVKAYYLDLLALGCTKTEFSGWDFLFSIADLHPFSKVARVSVPMPGAPDCSTMKSPEERNQWNCMKPEERMPFYKVFWMSLGLVLPYDEWRRCWFLNGVFKWQDLGTKDATMKWLWATRCKMERELELVNRCQYSSLCKVLQTHRSGCSKSKNARTCRKKRGAK